MKKSLIVTLVILFLLVFLLVFAIKIKDNLKDTYSEINLQNSEIANNMITGNNSYNTYNLKVNNSNIEYYFVVDLLNNKYIIETIVKETIDSDEDLNQKYESYKTEDVFNKSNIFTYENILSYHTKIYNGQTIQNVIDSNNITDYTCTEIMYGGAYEK